VFSSAQQQTAITLLEGDHGELAAPRFWSCRILCRQNIRLGQRSRRRRRIPFLRGTIDQPAVFVSEVIAE
jgi:hypothetical protein